MAGIGNFAICRGNTGSDPVWFLSFFIYFTFSLTRNTHPLLTHDMLYSKGRGYDRGGGAGYEDNGRGGNSGNGAAWVWDLDGSFGVGG